MINTSEGTSSFPISLNRGIFQGDSLSPLLFCLCVALMSHRLRKGQGFAGEFQKTPLTHLMFMDDLKVYEKSRSQLEKTVLTVEDLSSAMGMTLGLKKCATAHMKPGKVEDGEGIALNAGEVMKELKRDEGYRYLGVSQLFVANLKETRGRVMKEYCKRKRQTWESSLNARNKVKMTNSWGVSVLRHFFMAIRGSRRALLKLDRKTRKTMRQNKCHHRNASLQRLYLSRDEGGRGLQSVTMMWEREIVSVTYLLASRDPKV